MTPAKKQKIAVRVPDGNMAHRQANPTMAKKILCLLILLVRANIRNATDVDAIPIPNEAASL